MDEINTRSPEETLFARKTRQVEEELFASADGGALGWQVVQFYRTLLINIVSIFVLNPIYRTLVYGSLIVAFLLHDVVRRPYKDRYLNFLQPLTSACLLAVVFCNVVSSVSFMVDISTIPHVDDVANGLAMLELALYVLVPASLLFWMMFMLAKKKTIGKKMQ